MKKDEIYDALVKRALGCSVKEESEEYSVSKDGAKRLIKTKISVKEVPPELAAIKILMQERKEDFDGLTEEELLRERDKYLSILAKEYEKTQKHSKTPKVP